MNRDRWIITITAVIKFLLFSLIIAVAQKIIPFAGTFAYPQVLDNYHLSPVFSARANFDGIHYLLIAQNGYTQYQQAFFPAYPLLIRFVTWVTQGNSLVIGVLISKICFVLGLFILTSVVKKTLRACDPFILFLMILAFPTSFFFGTVYTEGLFFFLVISCIYFLQKKKTFAAICIGTFASATRLVGAFLIIPMFVVSFFSTSKKRLTIKPLLTLLLPLTGLILYMVYLKNTTGDPLFFISSQPAFGAMRSSHAILLPQVYFRYLKIFISATFDYHYWIAIVEFSIFNVMLVLSSLELYRQVKKRNALWIGVGIFSVVNLLLPTLTGTLSSIPRYSLLSISSFMYLASIQNKLLQKVIITLCFILQAVLLVFFTQGYFVS
jgi:hypothetical protein